MPRGSTVFDDDSVLGANAPVPMGPPIDIRRIVMLRLPVFLITVAVTAPVLVPLAWLFAPRDYVAAAEIRFLSQRPRIMDSEAQGGDFARTYEKFVSTQVALITGTSILTQALEDPAVSGIPEIASAGDKLEFLRDHLSARLRSGTELLVIECSMARRESAQRVLETVVKVYMDGASRQLATAGSERLSVLMTERDTRKDDLEKLQRQLVALQSQLGTDASAGTATEDKELLLYRESLVKSQDDVSRAEQDVRAAEQRAIEAEKLSQTYQSNPGTSVGGPDVQAVVETDARVVTLAEQVAAAQLGVVTAQGQYVKGSAKLARAEEALAALESQLDQARQRVTGEVLRGKAHALRLEVDAYKGKVSEAEERVAKYNQFIADRSKAIEDKAGDYAKLQDLARMVDERQTLIAQLNQQITDISLESKAPAQIELASPVTTPDMANYRTKLMAVFGALLASIALGVAVAAVRELTDQSLRSPVDIARVSTIPVIAAIPHTSQDPWLESKDSPFLKEVWPYSISADHLRRVLTSIVYPPDGGLTEMKSVLVTSPTRGDGKTTLACSIAVALAHANRRALLVDLSYVKPGVEPHFGLEVSAGLSELLSGRYRLDQMVRPTRIDNLFVLGPGQDELGLSHRLVSDDMANFVKEAERHFTHVIFDAPPSLLMSDANLIAPLLDGVIVVAGVNTATRGMLSRCLTELQRIDANVLGIVVNAIRPVRGGYLRKNLDLQYNYATRDSA